MQILPLQDAIFHGAQQIPRDMMPQIDADRYDALFAWLAEQNVSVRFWYLAPEALSMRQDVDFTKVHALSNETLDKPILISNDLFVLDGNHRAAGHKLARSNIAAICIDLPFADAVELLLQFPDAYEYGDGATHPIKD